MVRSSISYKGHMVEYLYMGGLKLKTIPCSLVKSFPRLRWWDLRFLLYMANVLPLYCCQHIIANIILYCQYISCSNCLPSNSRDNRIIHLPPALAYHPCLEVPCIISTAFSGAIVVGLSEIPVQSQHIGPIHFSSNSL